MLALGGLVILLFLLLLFAGNRNSDQDKLTTNEMVNSRTAADPQKRCASQPTYDLIKRELFRRAAQVRGSDQTAFARLSGYAVVRMENPVLENESSDTDAVNCSGSLSLDLPPGVTVVGGRTTLTSDIDYTVQRAADNSGDVVLLRNADAIVTPLATLARINRPSAPVAPDAQPAAGPITAPAPAPPQAGLPASGPAPQTPPPLRSSAPETAKGARPSFNCANARTRGEVAVCSNASLATLDRQMAAQFGRAMSVADPSQRALLDRTRASFLTYRDRCGSNACIADAYQGRMREISDIMSGRWVPLH